MRGKSLEEEDAAEQRERWITHNKMKGRRRRLPRISGDTQKEEALRLRRTTRIRRSWCRRLREKVEKREKTEGEKRIEEVTHPCEATVVEAVINGITSICRKMI
ncbi:hypothetical protein HPP92_008816 [Vanilla planifolia]|uniref:Uncharacterized protein n=1 Tax=Vanilla planifolia TaxID=51239 RepID=A0A835RF17_VANPL|nr:hypothetical protein HPP92_008816 [Vanilla planifolia]